MKRVSVRNNGKIEITEFKLCLTLELYHVVRPFTQANSQILGAAIIHVVNISGFHRCVEKLLPFYQLRHTIGLKKNSRHFYNQSEVKPNHTRIRFPALCVIYM